MMWLKPLKKRLVAWLGPSLAYWTIRLLSKTMHLEVVNPEIPNSFWAKEVPFTIAFWHGRLLMMPLVYKGRKASFLVSPHRDGQLVGKALARFGFHPIEGSTFRRSFKAFREMIKAHGEGFDIGIAPDGPRGPRFRVHPGVIELARHSGRPILPVSFSASRRKILGTWDHFLLPYPFSRGVFIWGDPIAVEPGSDKVHLEEKRMLLERRLNELTERADRYFTDRG
jgi:lysophospholipid acyltransferase (LPLAT)-like uncharacterized protein